MGFLSGITSFVEKHSDVIHGVLDVAGFIPGVGAVADMANAAIYAAEGDWMNAASSVVSAIPGIGDTMALASKSAKAAKAGLKGMKEMSAVSKAKGMKKVLGALRGKAKTGAKKAGQKLKNLWGNIKKKFKKKCTGNKCFTGDTPVFTSNGYRPIREMQKGDDIYSRDEKTGETGIQEVEEVFCTGTHTVYHIWLDGKEEIKTTAYHPVYVREQGWVSAINLREGDIVETMDGPARITKIVKVRHEEKVPTYNLHVKEWASYFVGKVRVYVHNGKGNHKPKAKSKRLEYMGKTPGKKSKTGREVIERMRGEGKIRDTSGGMEFKAGDGKWYPIKDADMAHTTDAVSWWNKGGYKHGPKSKQAREFMKDSNNYTLEHYSINRSQGAKLGQTYRSIK